MKKLNRLRDYSNYISIECGINSYTDLAAQVLGLQHQPGTVNHYSLSRVQKYDQSRPGRIFVPIYLTSFCM